MDVYLSYSRQDSAGFATHLYEALDTRGDRVFFDVADIPAGASWVETLETAVQDAEVFVALVGPGYLSSSWIEAELSAALVADKLILPVLVEDCDFSQSPLRFYNMIDARGDMDDAIREILLAVEQIEGPGLASRLRQLLRGDGHRD